jgi:chromosome segregation ATPase
VQAPRRRSTAFDALKEDYAELKGELAQLGGLKEDYMRTKAELGPLKEDHAGTKAELEQSRAAIQLAETKIETLEAELASFSEAMAADNRGGGEMDEVKDKLQAAELTNQELRDQIASTSANLDALIASNAPRITKVMWHVTPARCLKLMSSSS